MKMGGKNNKCRMGLTMVTRDMEFAREERL